MTEEDQSTGWMAKGYGWHMPPNAKKFHYFENGRSLCGRYDGTKVKGTKDGGGDSTPHDCAKCGKTLDKRRAKAAKAAKANKD